MTIRRDVMWCAMCLRFSLDCDEKNSVFVFFRSIWIWNRSDRKYSNYKQLHLIITHSNWRVVVFLPKNVITIWNDDVFSDSLFKFFPMRFFFHLQIEIGPQAQFSLQNEIVFIYRMSNGVFFGAAISPN